MFERYTEKARRVIFFARYEASEYGSRYIGTEHLLLGLLREDRALGKRFLGPNAALEKIREEIDRRVKKGERLSVSVEVPLSEESKKILNLAGEEAERLGHRHIGTEHMVLGMLRVEGSLAAQILHDRGLKLETLSQELAKHSGVGNTYVDRTKPELAELLDDLRKKPELLNLLNELRARMGEQVNAVGFKAHIHPINPPLPRLESFLSGLKKHNSEQLLPFFAKNARFIDVSGKSWNREEIGKHFETLFILYAKKNAAYTIEETIDDTNAVVVAIALWRNAVLASMERVWMHRMSVVLVPEGDDWAIALIHVTPFKPS